MEIKLSVIIPIYKVEKYLNMCVDSVLSQDFQSIEVILVDDGSPDLSPQICDNYLEVDSRIKVIHKKNGGLSDARNAGLKEAKGEYVIFLDSDDYWIDQSLLSNIFYNPIYSDSDVIFFERTSFIDGRTPPTPHWLNLSRINSLIWTQALSELIESDQFIISACLKFVKRTILIDNNIYFEKGRLSEDFDWSMQVVLKSRSLKGYDICSYAYRLRQDSITHTFSCKHMDDLLSVVEKWTNYLLYDSTILKDVRILLLSYCYFQYCILLGKLQHLKKCERKNYYSRLKRLSFLHKYALSKKTKLVRLLYFACFKNISLTSYALGKYLTYAHK